MLFTTAFLAPLALSLPFTGAPLFTGTPGLATHANGNAAPQTQGGSATPPGLVQLRGGTTIVGSTPKEIQELVDQIPAAGSALRVLDAETPQRRVAVAGFYYGITEVTHEQYAAFARATGARPLQDWGAKAIEQGRKDWFDEMNKINEQRRAEGKTVIREKFDAAEWWEENWSDSDWDLDEALRLMPVTHVNYADALAYCQWAGVRLPTEEEYQHAVRGKGKSPYPWGDEWETGKYCGTNEVRGHAKPYKVGHFESGKSSEGLYELSGNVWEWTSSPYVAPEKFKKNKYKVNGEKKEFHPKWNGNQRIAVGGSFQNARWVARCSVRRSTPRNEVTNALGFRIAASSQVGLDIANSVMEAQVKGSDHRVSGVTYNPSGAIAKDRWESGSGAKGAPDGYGVIAGYEYLAYVPVSEMEETQDASFRRDSLTAPAHVGFLSISEPMLQPELPAGTYLLAFRSKGKVPKAKPAEGEETTPDADDESSDPAMLALIEGLDLESDNLLFINAETGERSAFLPISGLAFGKGDAGGSWGEVPKSHMEVDPNNPKKQIKVEETWLRCDVRIATKIRRRCLVLGFEMMPAQTHFDHKWRK